MFRRRKFVFDDIAKQTFLEQIEETGLVTKAARTIGTITRIVLEELKVDDEFSSAFDDAMLAYNDRIMEEIHRRAIDGVEEDIYFKGIPVGKKTVYSDSLLQMHAKANIEKYRDKSKQEVTITGGVLVAPAPAATAQAWLESNSPKALLPPSSRDGIEDQDERVIDVEPAEPVPV